MFFEASEKKIEIVVSNLNLRELGEAYWRDVVAECHAEVISSLSSDQVDAHLLSESSLFVWANRMVMITCGETLLLKAILKLIGDVGRDRIESLIFQRKNEFDQSRQKTTFADDVRELRELVSGTAYRFGRPDGHHHYMFTLDRPYSPVDGDKTAELLMYHLPDEVIQVFCGEDVTKQKIRELLLLHQLEGFMVDDHLFEPYGYSFNGIKGDQYFTIHVTPQSECSYISYEMSLGKVEDYAHFASRLIEVLKPNSFDLLTFNVDSKIPFDNQYYESDQVKIDLVCGYRTQFYQYNCVCHNPRSPDPL